MQDFVSSSFCLKCQGCCRFLDKNSILRPVFNPIDVKTLKEKGFDIEVDSSQRIKNLVFDHGLYYCPFLERKSNRCLIYLKRPFDCWLYPFLLCREGRKIYLGVHNLCPFVERNYDSSRFQNYVGYLKEFLSRKDAKRQILLNIEIIQDYSKGEVLTLERLPFLEEILDFSALTLEHRSDFEDYLYKDHSFHSFNTVFMHTGLSKVLRVEFEEGPAFICVHRNFVYTLVFLGNSFSKEGAESLFSFMDNFNTNSRFSVIENISRRFIKSLGAYSIRNEFPDYVYLREDLVNLKGKRFKAMRWERNYFVKNYDFKIVPLEKCSKEELLYLYKKWESSKDENIEITRDSFYMLEKLLDFQGSLNLEGLVLFVGEEIIGFTLGCKLKKDVFLVLYEVVLPQFKGGSTFIFTEFIRGKERYINTMDDAGINSLRFRKEHQYPFKKVARLKLLR